MIINPIVKALRWRLISLSKSRSPHQSLQDCSSGSTPYLSAVTFYRLPPRYLCFGYAGFLCFPQTWQPCTRLRAFAPAGPPARNCNALSVWLIPLPSSCTSFMLPFPVRLDFIIPNSTAFPSPPSSLHSRHSPDPSVFYCSLEHASKYFLVWLLAVNSMRAETVSTVFFPSLSSYEKPDTYQVLSTNLLNILN